MLKKITKIFPEYFGDKTKYFLPDALVPSLLTAFCLARGMGMDFKIGQIGYLKNHLFLKIEIINNIHPLFFMHIFERMGNSCPVCGMELSHSVGKCLDKDFLPYEPKWTLLDYKYQDKTSFYLPSSVSEMDISETNFIFDFSAAYMHNFIVCIQKFETSKLNCPKGWEKKIKQALQKIKKEGYGFKIESLTMKPSCFRICYAGSKPEMSMENETSGLFDIYFQSIYSLCPICGKPSGEAVKLQSHSSMKIYQYEYRNKKWIEFKAEPTVPIRTFCDECGRNALLESEIKFQEILKS